ncbi:hypothetical protein KFZ76_04560 [Methylovulum psychrotolerans]|uniref:hypothetical protein n=1 Tax=Methylovulum psychrotolerans TaxID=1704499 RepID=UPI001BFF4E1F|nr:hypothetical protein [Methylovulum psychrotolerans]MBT9096985.1 hypothetical protein [Methylovulum psychrotolerans]
MKIKARLEKLEHHAESNKKLTVKIIIFGRDKPLPEPIMGDKVNVIYGYADDDEDEPEGNGS